jgi:hypothetical protein
MSLVQYTQEAIDNGDYPYAEDYESEKIRDDYNREIDPYDPYDPDTWDNKPSEEDEQEKDATRRGITLPPKGGPRGPMPYHKDSPRPTPMFKSRQKIEDEDGYLDARDTTDADWAEEDEEEERMLELVSDDFIPPFARRENWNRKDMNKEWEYEWEW